jgi:adenosylhomocysteine nucleosidase
MGCAAARHAAHALIAAGARALASWGMAGGLDPKLAPGTICLPDEVLSEHGTSVRTAHYWRDRLSAAVGRRERVHHGRLVTTAHLVSSLGDKATLFRQSGAAAVDMESAAVGEVASHYGFPFIAVRVIVDGAHDILPRAVTAAADAAGQIRLWQLIGSLARAPADLAPVIRLARRYRSASRSLAVMARSAPPARHAFPAVPDAVRS